MSRFGVSSVTRLLSLAVACVDCAAALYAQGLTGQISGTVVDPSGNVAPRAKVELVNTGTAQSRDASTDDLGNFVFTQLLPGTYRLKVSVAGFKTYEQQDIVLTATERVVLRQIKLDHHTTAPLEPSTEPFSGAILELAEKLVGPGLIPAEVAQDAVHVAAAVMHRCEFLLTWNFRHLANAAIRSRLERIVVEHGYGHLTICTPDELAGA